MLMDTVRELCAIDGVSSFEDGVREYIKSRIEPYADSVFQDAMGNLIAFKKGSNCFFRANILSLVVMPLEDNFFFFLSLSLIISI